MKKFIKACIAIPIIFLVMSLITFLFVFLFPFIGLLIIFFIITGILITPFILLLGFKSEKYLKKLEKDANNNFQSKI